MEGPNITKKYFDSVKKFGDMFVAFINKIEKNKQLLQTIHQSASFKEQSYDTPEKLVKNFCILDLGKCLSISDGLSNYKSKETFALMYVIAKICDLDSYANINILDDSGFSNTFADLKSDIEKVDQNFFSRLCF